MCLGIPMKILTKTGEQAIAEIDGVGREISLTLLDEDVSAGDYVIVHAGFAISRLNEDDAQATLELMKKILLPESDQ